MEFSSDLVKLFESDDEGIFDPPKKSALPNADDRLIDSFKSIVEFVEQNDRMPEIEASDINEATLAKRLEYIRSNPDKIEALQSIDSLGLLVTPEPPKSVEELFESDDFGLFSSKENDILNVKNVPVRLRSPIEPKAKREEAKDFENFRSGFEEQQIGLKEERLKLVRYYTVDQLHVGSYYVHDGQMLRIVDVGDKKRVYDRNKERFRIIFENGTESNMYRRSLSARLYEGGYCVVDANYVDYSQELKPEDEIKGYVYVLASQSEDPKIASIKDLYKIGYSTTPVEDRIKDAAQDPTYLMAPVKVVDSYTLTGEYNPQKVEHFLHRIFADAALDINIIDGKGRTYVPREWYSVPLNVIQQAIRLLRSGEITKYVYDSDEQKMKEI